MSNNLTSCLIILAITFITGNEGFNDHIRALAAVPILPYLDFTWDSSGNLSVASGVYPAYLDLISQRFRLTYSWVPVGKSLIVEDTPSQKGLITHLIENIGDVAVCASIPAHSRYMLVDFTVPIGETTFSIVIPMPSTQVNNVALVQPFDTQVWIGVIVCFITIVFVWYLFEFVTKSFTIEKRHSAQRSTLYFAPIAYTLTVILSQGNTFPRRILPIRLIAAIWCLAAFVLVPAYSGKLTSFLTSPVHKPLIDSHEDIITGISTGLKVAVERGMGVDVQFQHWAKLFASGTLDVTVGKMAFVSSNATFRCSKVGACIDKVAEGKHVAIVATPQARYLLSDDWINKGKCRITLAKHSFNKIQPVWLLQKRSPLLRAINQGILEIDAFGLSNYLKNYFETRNGLACLKVSKVATGNTRISLNYMSGTFYVFLVGCGLAVVTFTGELLFKRYIDIK